MPDKPFAVAKETVSVMPWSQYGTRNTYVTSQTSTAAGNRDGKLSWLVTANYLDSWQQPLTYTTNGGAPSNTTGTIPALSRTGRIAGRRRHRDAGAFAADLGQHPARLRHHAAGPGDLFLRHLEQPPDLRSADLPEVDDHGPADLRRRHRICQQQIIWDETHVSNAVSLKSDTKGKFDFDLAISSYNYLEDIQLNPFTVTAERRLRLFLIGKITRMDGTNWQNGDAKGIWRPFGFDGSQEISFGVHGDRYRLENPVYHSSVWYAALFDGHGAALFDGVGETNTGALWVQDAWKILPNLKLTLGRAAGELARV